MKKKLIVSKNYTINNIQREISFYCNFLHQSNRLKFSYSKGFNEEFKKNSVFDHNLTTPICDEDANKTKDELNTSLAQWLNNFHKKTYCEQYWAVVLYPFIHLYVEHIYVMFKRMEFLLNNFEIEEILIDKVRYNYQQTPKNIDEFISTLADVNFNNFLFMQLISEVAVLKNLAKNIKITKLKKIDFVLEKPSDTTKYVAKNLKSIFRDSVHKFSELVPFRATQPFIIGSFFPYFQDFMFKLINLSSPKLVRTPEYKMSFANSEIREEINLGMGKDNLEKFIFTNIRYFLPTAHIEDFKKISAIPLEYKWPKSPRYIFTSNNYFWDEPFKVWSAEKMSQGTPLIIGQHGNNFGTNTKYRNFPEERISNKFLTWGWKSNSKHIPFAVVKTIGRRRFGKANGGLLFIISTNDNRTSPISFIMNTHFDRLISASFVITSLTNSVKGLSSIRLLHKNSTLNGNEAEFFKKNNPDVNIEYGETPFMTSIACNRLIVFCYDSTGMLECISMNKPCICMILEDDLLILEPEAMNIYKELIQAGIYYTDPDALSSFINKNWSNINEWWCEKNRQDIIKRFSGAYANSISNPLIKLRKTLNDLCK
jgi:putative transferase (TIGR04331 family)